MNFIVLHEVLSVSSLNQLIFFSFFFDYFLNFIEEISLYAGIMLQLVINQNQSFEDFFDAIFLVPLQRCPRTDRRFNEAHKNTIIVMLRMKWILLLTASFKDLFCILEIVTICWKVIAFHKDTQWHILFGQPVEITGMYNSCYKTSISFCSEISINPSQK